MRSRTGWDGKARTLFPSERRSPAPDEHRALAVERLSEETPHLFEVPYQIAAAALTGRGEELEVGGFHPQPGIGIGRRSAGRRKATGKQEKARRTPHDRSSVSPL